MSSLLSSHLRSSQPPHLLSTGRSFRLSPSPYPLTPRQIKILTRLGPALHIFQKALNHLYKLSWQGKAIPQIAQLLDAGKPEPLIRAARHRSIHNHLPHLIRPDLIVTENGFALCEIDSVPGGLGLTAWLQETYAPYFPEIIGAPDQLRTQFHTTFPDIDLVISQESIDYLHEWQWLLGADRIHRAESYTPNQHPIYRFFEAFDHARFPWLTLDPPLPLQPPLKPQLEEKLALGLFWLKPLESYWREHLGTAYFELLRTLIPRTWILTPDPLPWHATLPGLDIHSWHEVAHFSQKQRRLVLKISGYHPKAWGSRGVIIGHDVSSETWQAAIQEALDEAHIHPRVLQPFIDGKLETHAYFSDLEDKTAPLIPMTGRTRLCPYYFHHHEQTHLAGILATHCPANKKILHGMSDAILMPCFTSQTKASDHE